MTDTTESEPDQTDAEHKAIHRLITEIIGALPAIGKDRTVTGGGPTYQYRGIEDILPHIRAAFTKHGVHVTPSYAVLSDQTYTVRSGAEWRRVVIEGTFRFWCGNGSYVETVTIGEASDAGDKSFNKAMTAAYKYALVQTFCLAEVEHEDPDALSSAESESFPQAQIPDGHLTAADAKAEFMDACGGDRDCAKAEWEAAALKPLTISGEHFYPVADVLAATDAVEKPGKDKESAPEEPPAEEQS